MIKVRYFASLRERLGIDSEELELPEGLVDLAGLSAYLGARDGCWGEAFSSSQTVMMALNQEAARPDTALVDGDEVAFFPPVTGG
jgi:molybdopterin synthase sulfur carrier subunit